MDKAVNNSYPNQNLVKVKTINFLTFLFFLKFPNIWINIQKQTDLSILFIFYVFFKKNFKSSCVHSLNYCGLLMMQIDK